MSTPKPGPRTIDVEVLIRWYEAIELAYQQIDEKPFRAKHTLSELEDQIDAIINPRSPIE